jgi:hypothetical protein
MHDKLFGNQRHLRSHDIIGYALAVHLEPEAFMAECVRTVCRVVSAAIFIPGLRAP